MSTALLPTVDATYSDEWTVDARVLGAVPADDVDPAEGAVRAMLRRLGERNADTVEAIEFARSEHDLPQIPGQTSSVYRRFAELCKRPWGRLIVEALSERSRVVKVECSTGFDFEDAWRRDNLDQMQSDQWHTACETGSTAWMVYPVSDEPDAQVRISVESGRAVHVSYDPWGTPTEAIKVTPTGDSSWRVDHFTVDLHRVWTHEGEWELKSTGPNRIGAIPIVEARYRKGWPELFDMTSTLRSIERTIMEGHVAAHVAAYPQRWASGIERYLRDGDDQIVIGDDGKPIELPTPWQGAVDAVFTADSPDAKFGAFPPVDIRMYIAQIESDASQLGVLSRVPANYLSVSGQNLPNADSLAAAHDPFIAKIESVENRYGLAVERLARTYATAVGDDAGQVSVTWAPLVEMSEQSRADSVLKWSQVGENAPMTWVLRRAGVPEDDINEFATARLSEDLLSPGPDMSPALRQAIDMVTNQPTIIQELTVAEIVGQLEAAGLTDG